MILGAGTTQDLTEAIAGAVSSTFYWDIMAKSVTEFHPAEVLT